MKLLSFIFSIYILLLPCLPCTDKEECVENMETLAAQRNHDHHQHEEEGCNPFCTCSCCGQTFASNFTIQKITSPKVILQKNPSFLYRNILLPAACYGNIWQPPRCS